LDLTQLISLYGIWIVAGFVALESIGFPVPAEATLIAAAFFAARTHDLDIWSLVAAAACAAIAGDMVGFWAGRKYGPKALMKYGKPLGLTEERARMSQWLFFQYGGRFVFAARFLPFLRNMAAMLAGANRMPPRNFYLGSSAAAVVWVTGYALAAYSFGEAFTTLTAPAAVSSAIAAAFIMLALPSVVVRRYEKRISAKVPAASHQYQER
jgi:membrane protein DedA with SNARE-associated domain